MADTNDELSYLLDTIKKADIIRKGAYGKDVRNAIANAIMLAANGSSKTSDDQFDPINHANIYRGKNLGNAITPEQLTAIRNGTFDDLYVGDYWTINGTTYRIADFDYFYNFGFGGFDFNEKQHHIVVVNDVIVNNSSWPAYNYNSDSDSNYADSTLRSYIQSNVLKTIENDFGTNNIIKHYEMFDSDYYFTKVELLDCIKIFGYRCNSSSYEPNGIYHQWNTQLALFRLNRGMIVAGIPYWIIENGVETESSGDKHTLYYAISEAGGLNAAGESAKYAIRVCFAVG